MRPLLRRPSQYFSAVSWEHAMTQASPLMCASCNGAVTDIQACQVYCTSW